MTLSPDTLGDPVSTCDTTENVVPPSALYSRLKRLSFVNVRPASLKSKYMLTPRLLLASVSSTYQDRFQRFSTPASPLTGVVPLVTTLWPATA